MKCFRGVELKMIFPDENITGLPDLFLYISSGTNTFLADAMGIGLSLVIFYILFMMLKSYSFDKAFVTSSFVTVILGLFLMKIGLLKPATWWIEIILLIVAYYFLHEEWSKTEP